MIIEIRVFRLAGGVAEDDFVRADAAFQTGFVYRQSGIIRRTTARGAGGSWLVATLWASPEDADAAEQGAPADPAGAALLALIDPGSVSVQRFEPLPG